MKKLFIICTLPILLIGQGCSSWVDEVSESPNLPTAPDQVTPGLLLTVSELAMQTVYTGQLARTASILTQQTAGNQFQMIAVRDYLITEQSNTNEWSSIYADALVNQQTLIELAGDVNPYYRGIATILKCMTIGLATDYWGDIPYSQALNGLDGTEASLNPAYDAQETILVSMQNDLEAAIVDLSQPVTANALLPGAEDYIYGGDVSRWIKTAYMLKARYANRLSKRDPAGSANDALMYITASGVTSNMDNCMAIWGTDGNTLNPWFSFNVTRRNYIKMGEFFVDLLTSTGDPRLPLYAALDENDGYSGVPSNGLNDDASNVGALYATDAAPLPLITYYEMRFIEAEANLRLGNTDAAAAAYNDAVKANLLATVGASDPAYEAIYADETGITITLDKIMTQKYIAMFTQPEVWADWRRTNLPTLIPNPDAALGQIPRRLPTCINERLYNENAIVVGDITLPVWWDE